MSTEAQIAAMILPGESSAHAPRQRQGVAPRNDSGIRQTIEARSPATCAFRLMSSAGPSAPLSIRSDANSQRLRTRSADC
jgi:hypothetical protein